MNAVERLKNEVFVVKKWNWIQLELKLYSNFIYSTAKDHLISFLFDPRPDGRIVCVICNSYTNKMVSDNTSRAKQLDVYEDWVGCEKQQILRVLDSVFSEHDLHIIEDLFVFSIVKWGHDPQCVCEICGSHVEWFHQDPADGNRIGDGSA